MSFPHWMSPMASEQRPVLVACPKCRRMVPECASPGACYYPPGSWVAGAESVSSKDESRPEPTRYSRPEGVMGGPCLHCGASQPEHVGLTCEEVAKQRKAAMRKVFGQAHQNATLGTIKTLLETMIHSAEVYVDGEDVITAYKIKTGALHKLIGHLGLSIPVNHPVVGAAETSRDAELMQSFWQQILKAWDAQGIVSDRVGLDVSIGAPLIEAARRTVKTPAPRCTCSKPEPALVNHGLDSLCEKCGQLV
jgi:hypothetical protein